MLGGWEFDAVFEAVGASVFFGHASTNSKSFGVVGDVFPTFDNDWAGLADGFREFHGGGVATVDEEQVGFAFAGCLFCPGVGVFVGWCHS